MRCEEVRDQLAEHALGIAPSAVASAVESHLRGCAACRAEAAELTEGAALVALAVEPTPPPDGTEERLLARFRRIAIPPEWRRRVAAITATAAILAVSALGFGAAMAGRAERFEVRASAAEAERLAALERFQQILVGLAPGRRIPSADTRLGQLQPADPRGVGGGAVLQLVSDDKLDFAITIVSGLGGSDAPVALPLRVWLRTPGGETLRAGTIRDLDRQGAGEVFAEFRRDLAAFTSVSVVDAEGRVLLVGELPRATA
ncbi:MAG: zf-HC2 domain-containing protein [Actinomycetota bacterium]